MYFYESKLSVRVLLLLVCLLRHAQPLLEVRARIAQLTPLVIALPLLRLSHESQHLLIQSILALHARFFLRLVLGGPFVTARVDDGMFSCELSRVRVIWGAIGSLGPAELRYHHFLRLLAIAKLLRVFILHMVLINIGFLGLALCRQLRFVRRQLL